jgi:hypothetical protein
MEYHVIAEKEEPGISKTDENLKTAISGGGRMRRRASGWQ